MLYRYEHYVSISHMALIVAIVQLHINRCRLFNAKSILRMALIVNIVHCILIIHTSVYTYIYIIQAET